MCTLLRESINIFLKKYETNIHTISTFLGTLSQLNYRPISKMLANSDIWLLH